MDIILYSQRGFKAVCINIFLFLLFSDLTCFAERINDTDALQITESKDCKVILDQRNTNNQYINISIKNITDKLIHIDKALPSCSCISVYLPKMEIDPYSTIICKIIVNKSKITSSSDKQVGFQFSGFSFKKPLLIVRDIHIETPEIFTLSSRRIIWTDADKNSSRWISVNVDKSWLGGSFIIENDRYITSKIIRLEEGKYRLEISQCNLPKYYSAIEKIIYKLNDRKIKHQVECILY